MISQFYLLCCTYFIIIDAQLHIKEQSKDGIEAVKVDQSGGDDDIFTSMHDLEKFFLREQYFIKELRLILSKKLIDPRGVENIAKYLSSYEDLFGSQYDEDDLTFIHNPLNVYNLVRHAALGWPWVEATLKEEAKVRSSKNAKLPSRVAKVLNRTQEEPIPGAHDLDGIAVGIARLQDYYGFNITSFVEEGILETEDWRYESNGHLSVWDTFKIAARGTSAWLLGVGVNMMVAAYKKAESEGIKEGSTPPFVPPNFSDLKTLENLMKTAKSVHDQRLDTQGSRTHEHSTNEIPFDKRLRKKMKYKNPKPKVVKLNDWRIAKDGTDKATKQEQEQYISLCQGIDLRPLNVTKHLYCKCESRNIPYYVYGPRKIEIVSFRPYITIIHNFITSGEIKDLITQVSSKLRRSRTGTLNGEFSSTRISEQAWVHEGQSQGAKRLAQRIDNFLDLSAYSISRNGRSMVGEPFQIANYGLSGQYGSHYDQFLMDPQYKGYSEAKRTVFNVEKGDRLATLMGYLSDVQVGGHTVFPFVGAYVKPQKGSVVLWWNMDRVGGYDVLTKHGGCPVMIGNKWITNKWIRANSQMFKKPCPPYTRKEIREFRYNGDKFQEGGFFMEP